MAVMRNYAALGRLLAQYFLYRWGRTKEPEVQKYYCQGLAALDHLFGWSRHLRMVGEEHVPSRGPAILAGNHILLDDPFVMGNAIHLATGGKVRPRAMMRDDFFTGMPPWAKRLADPDEVSRFIGAIQITREHVEPTQIKPFIELLRSGEIFFIYPGRTRSRSGLFMEYRDWIHSPGATSFLVAQAQAGQPGLEVPVIPMARTFNPVTKRGALIFGTPLTLPGTPDRDAQREFDYRLVVAMSNLVEVNVPQILAGLMYVRCLHGLPTTVELDTLAESVCIAVSRIRDRHVDPEAQRRPEQEVLRTLRYLHTLRVVQWKEERVEVNREAVTRVPSSFKTYRKENPVKHLVNQILHYRDVMGTIEQLALSSGRATSPALSRAPRLA